MMTTMAETKAEADETAILPPPPTPRVASVDALRGLTILLMVFVNDLGRAAPAWMHHIRPSNADGMTLADIVFPWFLFIVGVSIPLAFERAQSLGTPRMEAALATSWPGRRRCSSWA